MPCLFNELVSEFFILIQSIIKVFEVLSSNTSFTTAFRTLHVETVFFQISEIESELLGFFKYHVNIKLGSSNVDIQHIFL